MEKEFALEKGKHDEMPCNETLNKINIVENQLNDLYQEKARGAQIRARVNWVENGERNTKYFLGIEKHRQLKNAITQLRTNQGEIENDQEAILKQIEAFYSKLYETNNPDKVKVNDYFKDCKVDYVLNENEKMCCEGELTLKECEDAVSHMKSNKSPGSDGLTAEFYKTF